jgi:hypothetical protein
MELASVGVKPAGGESGQNDQRGDQRQNAAQVSRTSKRKLKRVRSYLRRSA